MSNLRIGFDAKKMAVNLTGIGNYSRSTVNALASIYPSDTCLLYTPRPATEECLKRMDSSPSIQWRVCRSKFGPAREYWRCRGIVKDLVADKVDIFHGLSNELPLGIDKAGIPSVVTIHDLIFLRLPQTYGRFARAILEKKTRHACRVADRIVAISEQTKSDIIRFYGVAEEKIEVIYQGCDPIFHTVVDPAEIRKIRELYRLPENYVLSVGTFEPRKNQLTLIKAMAREENAGRHLVLVSKPTKYQAVLEESAAGLGVADRVHFLNSVPNAHLPALYQGADLFCYLSIFEGFGIPVLEALVSGTPVLAATGSCLEEAGGPESAYVAPEDVDAAARLIADIADDRQRRVTMAAAGRIYARRFDAPVITGQLHDLYKSIL